MSVHVVSWVLRHSDEKLGRRLVLLVLADHAQGDGSNAYPSAETIAHEARLSLRQARYALAGLRDEGAITPTGKSRSGTLIYQINMGAETAPPGGADIAPLELKGVQSTTNRGADSAPEPKENQELKEDLAPAARNGSSERPRNELWDALTHVFGEATTVTAQSRRGKVVRSLRQARASPEDVISRAQRWPLHFEHATLTETALEKHWDTLPRPPLRRTR